jgi:hypothetical protein
VLLDHTHHHDMHKSLFSEKCVVCHLSADHISLVPCRRIFHVTPFEHFAHSSWVHAGQRKGLMLVWKKACPGLPKDVVKIIFVLAKPDTAPFERLLSENAHIEQDSEFD